MYFESVIITSHMNKRLLLFFLLSIALAFLFWYSNVIQKEFYLIVNVFNELVIQNEILAVFVFILLAAVAALISPLTSIPLVPIAVVIWGSIPTAVFLLSGWIIGDTISYFIGRYLGYKTVCYFVSAEKIDELSSAVKKRTTFSKGLLLRLILPAELGYAFGIIRYNFLSYLLLTLLAELPFAIISTYASEAVISGDTIKFLWLMIALLIGIYIAVRMVHKNNMAKIISNKTILS